MQKKQVENPNHKVGKRTGYYIIRPDGGYKIAPYYIERFSKLENEYNAVIKLLDMVQEHARGVLVKLEEQGRELWAELREDIGLASDVNWIYKNGVVSKPPEEKKGERKPNA